MTTRRKEASSVESPSRVRLHAYLADAGVASRRACEALIEQGLVRVNGTPVRTSPAWVDPARDRVEVRGEAVEPPSRLLYIMLNKPTHTLCTARAEQGDPRRTVLDLVQHPSAIRLFPVGRLDYDTTGLLLLTNDGELANRLTHPRFGVEKTYHAVVKGSLGDADAEQIERGIYLAERREGKTIGASRTARVRVSIHKRDRDRTVLELRLKEGRNRQVRRLLAAVGCPVKKLERVAMGPLRLKGIPRSGWRELTRSEIQALKRASRPQKSVASTGSSPSPDPSADQSQASPRRPRVKRAEPISAMPRVRQRPFADSSAHRGTGHSPSPGARSSVRSPGANSTKRPTSKPTRTPAAKPARSSARPLSGPRSGSTTGAKSPGRSPQRPSRGPARGGTRGASAKGRPTPRTKPRK